MDHGTDAGGHRPQRNDTHPDSATDGLKGQAIPASPPISVRAGRHGERLDRREAWATFRRVFGHLRPYKGRMGFAIANLLAMAGLDVLRPIIIMLVIDEVIVGGEQDLLYPYIGIILLVSLLLAAALFALTVLRRSIGERVVRDLRGELYGHLHHLDQRFHEDTPTGELLSRTGTDVQAVRRFMAVALLSTIRIVLTIAVIIVAGLFISIPMTLLMLLTGPAMYLTVRSFSRQTKPAFASVHQQNAALSEALSENVTGIRIVRSYGQEEAETERFNRENREAMDRQMAVARIRASHAPLMDFWVLLSRGILLLGGGLIVIGGGATIGALVAFDGFLSRIMGPIKEAHTLIDAAGESMSGADRMFELLDQKSAVTDPEEPVTIPDKPGIGFEGVHLIRGGHEVLRGIDLDVSPRETVALVGTTGSGKSSLVHLVSRSHDPSAGRVTLGGRDVKDYDLASLRRKVTVIHQESHLFSTTVWENIAYGRPDATREEVEEAARLTYAHEFISELKDGYMTVIGERGSGLSGGQRQRIAIARALVMRPDVLIIDDATSALDTETEQGIWMGLESVIADATTIIVAQRLSTLRGVNRIAVMDAGRIVELGNHDELIALDGQYAQMYALQSATVIGDGASSPTTEV
ncbi:MAG: ABC transporter ATP-binding protein [Nitriliruptoraceae bacterium]